MTISKPKNKQWYDALLVGGPHDLYQELRQALGNGWLIHLTQHFSYERGDVGVVPQNIDFVIILTDIISHAMQDKVIAQCRKQDVPFVRTQRKRATWSACLRQRGFTSKNPPVFQLIKKLEEARKQQEQKDQQRTFDALEQKATERAASTLGTCVKETAGAEIAEKLTSFWSLTGLLLGSMVASGIESVLISRTKEGTFSIEVQNRE